MAAEIIDLTLVTHARRYMHKLLDARGINYFLKHDGPAPFRLEPRKVEMIVRTASKSRGAQPPHPAAVEHCRKEIRRELIRRVVEVMLQTGM